jgi:RNA polymerase sigma-70 factor (ECF subfamily)
MACAETFESWNLDDDDSLVAGILAGDESCFEILHTRYRSRIYAFALKRLGDPVEAEDVVQEVFMQVHRCLASYQGRSALLTWMFGIAHNQVCRRFRRKKPTMVSLDEPEAIELSSPDASPDRCVDANRALRRCGEVVEHELTDQQRTVFYLKYAENRTTRAIAEELGKSNQAIKISLFRSRKTLLRHATDVDEVLEAV